MNSAPEIHFQKEDFVQSSFSLMEPIVCEQDIINTYSAQNQFSCKKYFECQKLMQENSKIGYKKAAKILGLKAGMTRWWHTKGPKRAVPIPLKTIEKLKLAGLLPFYEGHKDAAIIFNMLGVLFGDGGIDIRLNNVAFISSGKSDIDLWHSDLLKVFPFAIGKIDLVEGGEWGHSYNLRCCDRATIRFFAALGVPIGDKVAIHYTLPKWIFASSKKSRLAFLDGYLAAEVSVPRYRGTFSESEKYFTDFSIGISKIDFLEKEHINYLKSVEKLLQSVGISTTGNLHKNYSAGRHRKDGAFTANYRIFIKTIFQQVLFFNAKFNLRYAQEKKRLIEERIKVALNFKFDKQTNTSISEPKSFT